MSSVKAAERKRAERKKYDHIREKENDREKSVRRS